MMNYLGFRESTAEALVLNDVMIYHRGRTISHIMLKLTHLKETTQIRSVCIPGNLSPIDVTGLIILYLNARNVFQCGLSEEIPDFKIKKEFNDKPFFELASTVEKLYEQLSTKLGAPSFAITSRSSRKGHCVMHALRIKTQYPAMPIEMLEEELISHGTWATKAAMRNYLKGGCNQIKRTFDLLENMQPPPVTLDAKEHYVFLVDALETIRDWKIAKADPSVDKFEKNYLANGGKKQVKTTELIANALSSINFYKGVKLVQDTIPQIAAKVPPKIVNLADDYKEGGEVFKSSIGCEICKGICIKESPAIKEYDATIFKMDKKFYDEKMKKNDFGEKMAEIYAPQNNNHRDCLNEMFKEWSLS
uniref:Uncharacterized protein n=1 Tax=Panagrolaimus superbus TaxID=310955 RepID=A0A914YEJ9_9BILA